MTWLDLVQEVRRLEDAASRNEEELGNLAPGLSSTENRGIRYIIIIRGLQTDVVYHGHRVGRVLRYSPIVRIVTHPTPHSQASVLPLVLGGGAHSLARDGLGEFKFRLGDIHCGTLYILYKYFVIMADQ